MKMGLKEKLNVGCGARKIEGYTNVDLNPSHNPEIVGNALNLNMIKDYSISEVYSEHLIEHFDIKEIDVFFQECRRILIPNGKMVVIVPDMEYFYKDILKRNMILIMWILLYLHPIYLKKDVIDKGCINQN